MKNLYMEFNNGRTEKHICDNSRIAMEIRAKIDGESVRIARVSLSYEADPSGNKIIMEVTKANERFFVDVRG